MSEEVYGFHNASLTLGGIIGVDRGTVRSPQWYMRGLKSLIFT